MARDKSSTQSNWLLWGTLTVPLAITMRFAFDLPPLLIFVVGGMAIAILAQWMRRATEQVAAHSGPALGGLLNVSFGSAAELILALFLIAAGHLDVVRAQITGSIIGTSLLGLGLACLAGGWRREKQTFSRERAGLLSSLLVIVVLALLLPAVFDRADIGHAVPLAARQVSEQTLSIGVSIVLLILYGGNLVFTLVTHRDMFARAEGEGGDAAWSVGRALAVLVTATIAVAACAEIVSGALQASAEMLHLPLCSWDWCHWH